MLVNYILIKKKINYFFYCCSLQDQEADNRKQERHPVDRAARPVRNHN